MTSPSPAPELGAASQRRLQFHTVDVFCSRRFAGNPLAIVEEADDLDDQTMQRVAREFNLSETVFVQRPADAGHTAKVRIFTPGDEIPFAGHPTIGCAIHLAEKLNPGEDDFATTITLEEVAGLVPVEVSRTDGLVTAQLTAPVIPHAHGGEAPSVETAAAALGLEPDDIGYGSSAIGVYVGGPAFLYVRLGSRQALSAAKPSEPQWSRMTEAANTGSVYLYTPGGESPDTDYSARMFAPASGIPEDPATGSATAILAAALLESGGLEDGTHVFRLEQGCDMGRPSELGLEIDVTDEKIAAVRISGSSVRVSQGMIAVE